MADNSFESLFARLRRFPDVEADNLQAWDATDRLLLDSVLEMRAAGLLPPGGLDERNFVSVKRKCGRTPARNVRF